MASAAERDTCCVAVDWSGASSRERRKLWLALARAGRVERLEGGSRNRAELVEHLIELARTEPRLVVGIDFAFSFPAWFVQERGCASAAELWTLVEREGEGWLAGCAPPFWGRKGRRPTVVPNPYRATESCVPRSRGVGPKSIFQINGGGSVGTGSIRGMPWLRRLSAAGFALWPFDAARFPLVVEIYPRELTGNVKKASLGDRDLWLAREAHDQDRALLDVARTCEDAFDAFASALEMSRHAASFTRLEPARDERDLLEGRIWRPPVDRKAPARW